MSKPALVTKLSYQYGRIDSNITRSDINFADSMPLWSSHLKFLIDDHPTFISDIDIIQLCSVINTLHQHGNKDNSYTKELLNKWVSVHANIAYARCAIYLLKCISNRQFHSEIYASLMPHLSLNQRMGLLMYLLRCEYLGYKSTQSWCKKYGKFTIEEFVPHIDNVYMLLPIATRKPSVLTHANKSLIKLKIVQKMLIKSVILTDFTLNDIKETFTLTGPQWIKELNSISGKKPVLVPNGLIDWINKDIMRGKLAKSTGYKRTTILNKNVIEIKK